MPEFILGLAKIFMVMGILACGWAFFCLPYGNPIDRKKFREQKSEADARLKEKENLSKREYLFLLTGRYFLLYFYYRFDLIIAALLTTALILFGLYHLFN
jgi:hypothetical protein